MRTYLLLLSVFIAPQLSLAQVPLTGNALRLNAPAFAELRTFVSSRDSVRVEGVFGNVLVRRPTLTIDSLLGSTEPSGTQGPRLGLSDVTRIQVRGSASGTGALIGTGVGFAGGLAAGLGLTASLCSDSTGCSNEAGGVVIITMGSTVVGALLGALIGAPIKKWHTVYQAP